MLKYIIIIIVVFTGCENVQKNTVVFSQFPIEKNVTFNNFIKYDYGVISKMFLSDTSLIIYDWRAKKGYFFSEYGLISKLNSKRYIPHGRGKGKALGSLSAGIYNNDVWMYDVSLQKIIFSSIGAPDTAIYKEYPLLQNFYNIQFIDDLKIIANGNYQSPKTIQEVDLRTGKITADFGELKKADNGIPFYAWKRANEGFLITKPTNDKAVLAHLWNDEVEIFNLKTHKKIAIKGPENFEPEFEPFKTEDGKDLIQRNEKSRNAFGGAMATNKYIYLSYSGNNMASKFINYTKSLYVFDWDGNPVKKINFDRYVAGFTVGDDDETLYAYDVISNFIVKTKI